VVVAEVVVLVVVPVPGVVVVGEGVVVVPTAAVVLPVCVAVWPALVVLEESAVAIAGIINAGTAATARAQIAREIRAGATWVALAGGPAVLTSTFVSEASDDGWRWPRLAAGLHLCEVSLLASPWRLPCGRPGHPRPAA
jgi:hypothetical protein